jgi:hypothetical protein
MATTATQAVQTTTTPIAPTATASATKAVDVPSGTATKPGAQATPALKPTVAVVSQDARYMDDRSGPVEVLQSLVNALNRKEYVRAYSYWSDTAIKTGKVPAYADFEKGYANTKSVELTAGTVSQDAGAGQLYYRVPVALKALLADGTRQTFVGCYTLHLSQPGIQGVPPFRPLAIESATMQQVPNDSDTGELMKKACPPQ